MASFGSFETDREVYSDPIYTVYAARKSGDPKSEYAIKLFSIDRINVDPENAAALDLLLADLAQSRGECVGLQEKAAANSAFIAPVFETGQDERGVWYATRFYPRSVNKIISGRVALTPEALQHIIRSIAQGALDLKRTCGRSHGDIVPSNVQISKSEKLSSADVVICDPLPGGEGDVARFEIADLRAIGKIMLQLVRQRATDSEEQFLILPILPSPEWSRVFGKATEGWLALCNRLLDPNLSLDQITLEQLVAKLDQLRPKSAVPPKLLIAVVALLLGLGAAALWFLRPGEQVVEVTSDPPGATIFLNKTEQGQKSPMQLKLKKGSYTIEARHAGLRLLEQSTNWVVPGGAPPKLHFQFAYGSIDIQSDPPGATIKRDEIVVGKTPAVQIVAAGVEVRYELELAGHVSKPLRAFVQPGQKLTLSEKLPRSEDAGTVELVSIPSGAKIFEGDKLLTEKTPEKVPLEQGTHTLKAVYKDWPPKVSTVEVKRALEVQAQFYFENGKVAIESDPSDASVFLGTNRLGNTPFTSPSLPAGPMNLRFERAGCESANVAVTVVDKRTVPMKTTLLLTNGVIELSSDPEPATILDSSGKEVGRTTSGTPFSTNVAPGTYSFTAHVEGLSDVPVKLEVGKREIKKHTFAFDYGTVLLESVPPGASVSAEGKSFGKTPALITQKPGAKFSYVLTSADYLPATKEVTLQSGQRNKSEVVMLSPEPVAVTLTSDPPGAQFYVGPALLTGSGSSFKMAWGTSVIRAKHELYPGLEEITETVLVKKGAANAHEFKFNYGTVALETDPPDANAAVYERGKLIGHTPINLFLRPGPVNYELIYEDQTNRIGTNVVRSVVHRFTSAFEIKRDYTNSIGMVLVRVKEGIYVGKFEVTQGEFQKVMKRPVEGNSRLPAVIVKWQEALDFCRDLSQLDSAFMATARLNGWSYALPTDDEWSRFAGTDTAQLQEAVFSQDREIKEIDLTRKSSNKAGLYDLFGNAAEWCVGANKLPITIGGSFNNRKPPKIPDDLMRTTTGPTLDDNIKRGARNIGFRCVLRPPSP